MHFKGSLRSPGDRGPGIRVSLEVDDYHLQIQRGTELMGRWYLADVEVVRDIAERFTLFLGDDEMEFLADDALVFAYEGVTRMQQGWINAQKKKRRHRRAAAEAARRKDEAPDEQDPLPEPVQERRSPRRSPAKAPSSELAKKLAAIARADSDQPADPPQEWLVEKSSETPNRSNGEAFDWAAAREEMTVGRAEDVAGDLVDDVGPVETTPAEEGHLKRREPAPQQTELWLEIQHEPLAEPEPDWIAPPEAETWTEPAWMTPLETEAVESTPFTEPAWMEPDPGDLRRRFEALEHAARVEPEPPTTSHVDLIEAPKTRRGLRSRERDPKPARTSRSVLGQESPELAEEPEVEDKTEAQRPPDLRNDGHHPIESSTGLLAKLRRAPKVADDHVHVYQESRSTVGLTRRVCVECSHVSISTDD